MNIIGLVGFIGSGKDTVANMFVDNHGCVQDSFAAPLKDLCSTLFGWERHLLQGDTIESRDFRETPDLYWTKKLNIDNFTPRLALQLMGTEVLRNHFHEDIWLNSLEYRLRIRHQTDPCVVVSDARFQNELSLIKSMNGFVIWVQRGELPGWYDVAKTSQTNAVNRKIMQTRYNEVHESEWNWVGHPVDYIIKNNGTLDELTQQVAEIRADINVKNPPTALKIV